ncbi:MAG: glucose 1-dehydrogenase [Spirochaetes bacterium]|nr:glucose 1-dehydrogenase [Spirochaetota bacterium]
MGKLEGKAAIVTGAASGFGRETAVLFANEGARVVVIDRDKKGGISVADEIRKGGGEAVFVEADVSKRKDAKRAVEAAVDGFGKIDVLFNNAGILGPRGVYTEDFPEEEADRLIGVNFMGVFLCTKYALHFMVKSKNGSIITTGSDSAYLGNRGLSVYSATKGAVIAFSRVVAMEYAKKGIRANTISPGAGQTPMHAQLIEHDKEAWKKVEEGIPLGRACYPTDVAHAALFFASDDSKYITGANLMVDGGWTVRGL